MVGATVHQNIKQYNFTMKRYFAPTKKKFSGMYTKVDIVWQPK